MSNENEKYKKLIDKEIKIIHSKSIRYSKNQENDIDLKLKKIIKLLYSESFNNILIYPRSQFIKNIEKKFDKIISEKYSEYKNIKKSYIDNLKKEINLKFNNEYQLLKKEINDYIKNPKKYEFLTNFVPHCSKTEKVALHYCSTSSILGKFIQVNIKENNYVICVGCQKCFIGELIEMFCPFCQKNYYSSISSFNSNISKNLPFATWEKYHCGSIINEIMKCIKCKSNFYYDISNDKLVCLNKNCRFEAKPKKIIWKCFICSSDFISSAKAFNPLEIKMLKNSINYALIMNEVARPFKINYCNFCRSDISKATFNHKKDCDGILLMSKLNNKEVIVCNKCHGMNFYSQYSWVCPFCNKKLKRKNFLSSNKGNINFYNNNNITYDKNVFSFDNEKSDKNYQSSNKNNINIYNKDNFFRSTFVPKINKFEQEIKQYNSQENKEKTFDLFNGKNASESNRNSVFSIKQLFLKNDSKEKYDNKENSQSFIDKSKNSNSLGRSLKRKTTLYEILQKRNDKITPLCSIDKKESFFNNISSTNFNIKKDFTHSTKKDKSNPKEIIFKRYSLVEKNLRKNNDDNINSYNSNRTKRHIRKEFYNKNIVSNHSKLDEENEQDDKAEIKKNIYKSNRFINNNENYSVNKNEKQNENNNNLLKSQNQLKEKIEKIKINSHRFSINNKKYNKNKILEKVNYYTQRKNDNIDEANNNTNKAERLQASCSNASFNNNKNNFKKKYTAKEPKKPYKFFYLEYKNIKNNLLKNNTKPSENLIDDKKSLFHLNFSKNKEKIEENKRIKISLKRNVKENNFSPMYKPASRRRYYQSINSKDKKIKKKVNDNTIKIVSEPLKKNDQLDLKSDMSYTNKSTSIKKINNIFSEKNNAFLSSNVHSNTNHTKDNNTKNNVSEEEDEDNKESNLIINVDDFEMNFDNDNNNDNNNDNDNDFILSDSKINSIINKEMNDQVDSLYSPGKFEDIVKNCKIPQFEEDDYIYIDSIGEGSFGTIFEVEEKKTGKKFAIKKIICKDMQELIKQKEQMELAYNIEHENIMKIIKIKIKCLDFTTYSINELMELAISDWNQEILNKIKSKNYYNEKELINITKQIINGLLFLKSKNIAHRDIKPQNILIFPNNVFKLADFGEAKFINNITSFRTLKGCELYMSPALYKGWIHGKCNLKHNIFKSDIFSLGYCLIYAATLNILILQKIRKLNDNNSIINEINKCINKNIYSNKFINIISKMIDVNEEERYDIEDIYNEIENY